MDVLTADLPILFQDNLPQELVCPFCDQALRAPVKTSCGHDFCSECIQPQMTCSTCNETVESVTRNTEKHRLVQALPVYCTFRDAGCGWTGTLKQLQAHGVGCEHRKEGCPNCGNMVAGADYENHLAKCQVISCEYCNSLIKINYIYTYVFDDYNGPLTVREYPVPVPKDDEILIWIRYSGICHSDLHCWLGDFSRWTTCPRIGGHEGAGEVVQVGSTVDDWKVGDKAGVKAIKDCCYKCEYCKQGEDLLCPNWLNVGLNADGAFQEYIALKAIDAVKIPAKLDLAAAAPILCAGTTVYKALKESSVKPGEFVVLTGAGGGLGSLGIQYAKNMGHRVIAVDHLSKKDHCIKLGAEYFVDGFSETMADEINAITDGGAHGIVNLAIPKEPMEKAIDYLRKKGTLVLVALPRDTRITIDMNPILFKIATIKGTLLGTRKDMDEALDFAARGIVSAPYELVRLEDVPDVYQRLQEGKVKSRCVIDMSL